MGLRLYKDYIAGFCMHERHTIILFQCDIVIFIGFERLLIEANLFYIAINDKVS